MGWCESFVGVAAPRLILIAGARLPRGALHCSAFYRPEIRVWIGFFNSPLVVMVRLQIDAGLARLKFMRNTIPG